MERLESNEKTTAESFGIGDWRAEPSRCVLTGPEGEVRLEPKQMELLSFLAANCGRVVSKQEIMEAVWSESYVADIGVARNISQLRKILKDDPKNPHLIETIPKRGYRLLAGALTDPECTHRQEESEEVLTAMPAVEHAVQPYQTSKPLWIWGLAGVVLLLVAGFLVSTFNKAGQDSPADGAAALPTSKTIAVLPFVNISEVDPNDYFSDGLSEEILNVLCRIKDLRVVARTSSFAFKDKNEDIREIGRILQAEVILEGSVRRDGDRIRVTAKLVDAANGYQIWSDSYDRVLDDIFAIQGEIARAVVGATSAELLDRVDPQLELATTRNMDAHTCYLLGRFHLNRAGPGDFQKAIEHFSQAVAQDPQYEPAYAGLADIWLIMGVWGLQRPSEALPKALEVVDRVLVMNPLFAEGHAMRGYLAFIWEFDWQKAEQHFTKALSLNPNHPGTLRWHALYLRSRGEVKRSLDQARKAFQLDPLSIEAHAYVAEGYLGCGKFDDALETARAGIKINNYAGPALYCEARSLELSGELEEALKVYRTLVGLSRVFRGDLAVACTKAGLKNEALDILQKLEKEYKADTHYVSPYRIGVVHAVLGNKDKALKWFDKAFQQRDPLMVFFSRTNPDLAPIHKEPAFVALMKQMNGDPKLH